MHADLANFRSGKPGFYPDQSVYAEYACAEFGLTFEDIDGGTGLAFSVASKAKPFISAPGDVRGIPKITLPRPRSPRTNILPASSLNAQALRRLVATISFFTNAIAPAALRSRARRCTEIFCKLGATAFVKPLLGSRGDFAQAVYDEAMLQSYMLSVSRYYDSILMQPLVRGTNTASFCWMTMYLCGVQISACCAGRWRAFDPRSLAAAQ